MFWARSHLIPGYDLVCICISSLALSTSSSFTTTSLSLPVLCYCSFGCCLVQTSTHLTYHSFTRKHTNTMDHLCPRQTFASAPCFTCLSQTQKPKRPSKLLFRNYSYPAPPNSARFYPTTITDEEPAFRPTLQKSKSLDFVPTTQLAVTATAVKPNPITIVKRAATPPPTSTTRTPPRAIPATLPRLDEDHPIMARSLPETETQIKTLLHSINVPPAAFNESRRDSETLPLPCYSRPLRPIPIAQ